MRFNHWIIKGGFTHCNQTAELSEFKRTIGGRGGDTEKEKGAIDVDTRLISKHSLHAHSHSDTAHVRSEVKFSLCACAICTVHGLSSWLLGVPFQHTQTPDVDWSTHETEYGSNYLIWTPHLENNKVEWVIFFFKLHNVRKLYLNKNLKNLRVEWFNFSLSLRFVTLF